jgi:outer membrane protein TolC
MKDQSLYAWMVAAGLLLCGSEPVACFAQASSPAAPAPAATGSPGRAGQRVPSITPLLSPASPGASATARAGAPATGTAGAVATPRSPLDITPNLTPAPLVPGDLRFPINLATALRLSDARPLIVAAAQAKVWIAEAELSQAKVLWLPDINIGFDYLRHDGGGPDFNKGIMTAPSTNFFYGGAGLWGNQYGIIPTTDALYQPLVARQVLNARNWDIQSAKNDALRETADAYFQVHQQRGIYASTLYTIGRGHELVQKIAALGRDLVPVYEVDRARNMVADLEQHAASSRQQWRVSSARLTKVLRLDPRAVVEPLEHDHLQITLIDPGRTLDDLMPIALANRPEIASRSALVEAAEISIRRERARPFVPLVALTGFQTPFELFQAGIFGLGPNNSLNQWTGRSDVSIQPLFRFNNLGLGNLAQIKAQRGMESLAILDLFENQDKVVEDVFQALANVQSAAVRVYQAERALRTGVITFNGSLEGLQQTSRFGDVLVLISRPQEAVFALQLLQTAFDEYFTTVADYNRAQFELFHALGYPARELTQMRTPGEVRPVETARPAFLPPVGNGPPPATR